MECLLQPVSFIYIVDYIYIVLRRYSRSSIFFIILFSIKANRVTTMHDFGYVALNMKYVNPEDSGTYTCRATNELGEAVTSATLFVQCK